MKANFQSNPTFRNPYDFLNEFHTSATKHYRRWPTRGTAINKIRKEFEEMIAAIEHYERNQIAIYESRQTYLRLVA